MPDKIEVGPILSHALRDRDFVRVDELAGDGHILWRRRIIRRRRLHKDCFELRLAILFARHCAIFFDHGAVVVRRIATGMAKIAPVCAAIGLPSKRKYEFERDIIAEHLPCIC